MDVPGPERRLAAVLAADMVGYSRLMEIDETGTLARLKTHRIELIDPAIAKNRGRIIKTTGDGMLGEFHSKSLPAVNASSLAQKLRVGPSAIRYPVSPLTSQAIDLEVLRNGTIPMATRLIFRSARWCGDDVRANLRRMTRD